MAFQHLWKSADDLRNKSSAPSHGDLSTLHVPLLNIANEGKLQREIKDILDELSIMIHLINQQQSVVGHFRKNALQLLKTSDADTELGYLSPGLHSSRPTAFLPSPSERHEARQQKQWQRDKLIRRFEWSCDELQEKLNHNLQEMQNMKDSATSTSVSVNIAS